LLATNLLGIGTKHHFVAGQSRQSRIQNRQALQHFFYYVFGTIDEPFHEVLLILANRGLATGHDTGFVSSS
jgi:hypothetical protein